MHPGKCLKRPLNGSAAWFMAWSNDNPYWKTASKTKSKAKPSTHATACHATQQANETQRKLTQRLSKASQKQWAKLRPGVRHHKSKKTQHKAGLVFQVLPDLFSYQNELCAFYQCQKLIHSRANQWDQMVHRKNAIGLRIYPIHKNALDVLCVVKLHRGIFR